MDAATFLHVPQRALFASLWRDGWWCSRMQLPGHALKQGTERTNAGWVPKSLAEKSHVGWIIYGEIHVSFYVFLYVFIFQKRVLSWYQTIKISIQATNMDGDLLTISTYFNPSNSRQLFILGTKQRNFNDAQATRHKLEWRIGESMKNHVYHPLIFSGAMRGQ